MRGERGSVPASRSAWRDFECWSADATGKSRDAKDVLFFEPWLDTSTPDPDTIPTLSRHPDTPTPVSIDTRPDTPTPVSGQCQAILTLDISKTSADGVKQCQWCQSKTDTPTLDTPDTPDTPDTRHPRHSDTTGLDANEVQASMLTGLMMSRCLVCGICVRGITHVQDPPLYPLMPCCALSCAHQVPSPPDSRAIN